MQQALKIIDSFFYCEHYHCRISIAGCVKRRTIDGRKLGGILNDYCRSGKCLQLQNIEEKEDDVAEPKTKICRRCKLEKPVEEFSKNKQRIDGLDERCKSCKSSDNKNYRKMKKSTVNISSVPIIVKHQAGHEMILDMTGHDAIMAELENLAKNEIRTPEQQAVWIIKEYLKKDLPRNPR